MIRQPTQTLADLYLADETAWLDGMAELTRTGQLGELDYAHLVEYLEDMANRDRREVSSRLRVLLVHLLKWHYQKKMRTKSWRRTIITQRRELEDDLQTSRTLRNHAEMTLAEIYVKAAEWAAEETELPEDTFPAECPWTLEQVLSKEVLSDDN
jgi:hypothetical protein